MLNLSRYLLFAVLMLASGLLHLNPAGAQENPSDWPQFRGPAGRGVSAAKGLPLRWSLTENVVWKTELPGAGASSPVVLGDRIFLTSYSGYNVPWQRGGNMEQLKLHLVCLQRGDGRVLWTRDIPPQLPEQPNPREGHGYASNTPALDSEHVYAFFGKSGVFAFTHEGKQVWKAEVGSGTNGWGTAASPVLHGDLVIVNASVESGALVALNRQTGREVWRAGGIRESWNTPILVSAPGGKTELVVGILGQLLSFDPATGTRLWSCNTEISWYMVPSLSAHDGIVYCIGGRTGGALAVKTGGQGDVTRTHRLWVGRKGSNVPSLIHHDGYLYWIHENQGVAYCAEAKTGKIIYEERVPGLGQVYASPILADGKLYYLARDGRCAVLAAQPKFQVLATNDLRDRTTFNATPCVSGRHLLIRSSRYLYCLGEK